MRAGPRRAGRIIRTVAGAVLAAVGLFLLGCNLIGLPPGVTRWILRDLNRGALVFEVGRLTVDWRGRLLAHEVAVYRRGVVGPPVVRAVNVGAAVDWFAWRAPNRPWLRAVTVEGGTVQPRLLQRSGGDPAARGKTDPVSRSPVLPDGPVPVELVDCDLFGLKVEALRGTLYVQKDTLRAAGLTGRLGREDMGGAVAGELSFSRDGSSSGQFTTGFDPHVLLPLFRALDIDAAEIIQWFSFRRGLPACTAAYRWNRPAGTLGLNVRFQGNTFAYRGVAVTFANVGAQFDQGPGGSVLRLKPLIAFVGNRNVSGEADIDFRRGTVRTEAVSTIEPATLARMLDLSADWLTENLNPGTNTRIYVQGTIGYRDPALSRLGADVDVSSIQFRGLRAEDCSFRFEMDGTTNHIRNLRGRLYDGTLAASGAYWPEPGTNAVRYRFKGETLHVDARKLAQVLRPQVEAQVEGRLYGRLEIEGLAGAGRGRTAVGEGYVSMKHGRVFRLPLFGRLSEAVSRSIPGVDFALSQTDVQIPFKLRNGRLASDDIQIAGSVLSLTARGNVGLAGDLDFVVQVRPMKDQTLLGQAIRLVASPLSKLFEMRLVGTLDKPEWYAVNFSSDVLRPFQKRASGEPP